MSISVSVRKAEITVKTGTSRKTGRPYTISEQEAFVILPNGETRRITLQHEDGDVALPAGDYSPKDSAYWVGDFGALSISTRAKHWQQLPAKTVSKAA